MFVHSETSLRPIAWRFARSGSFRYDNVNAIDIIFKAIIALQIPWLFVYFLEEYVDLNVWRYKYSIFVNFPVTCMLIRKVCSHIKLRQLLISTLCRSLTLSPEFYQEYY